MAPVRMLHIHGTTDPVVGYNGNSTAFGSNLGLGVDAIMDYWQNANGCSGEPTIDTLPDLKNDGLRFIRYTYDCGTDLQHLKVVGGNHTWYDNVNQYDVDYKNVIYYWCPLKVSCACARRKKIRADLCLRISPIVYFCTCKHQKLNNGQKYTFYRTAAPSADNKFS